MMYKRNKGFTLIEVLIVLAVVGVMVSVAMLAIRGRDPQTVVDASVEQLAYALKVAQEETLFRRRALGLLVYQTGYLFVARDKQGWYRLNESFFKSRQLPEAYRLTLYVDATPQILEAQAPASDAAIQPQIQFIPDAQALPFEMLIDVENLQQRRIALTPSGRLLTSADVDQ